MHPVKCMAAVGRQTGARAGATAVADPRAAIQPWAPSGLSMGVALHQPANNYAPPPPLGGALSDDAV